MPRLNGSLSVSRALGDAAFKVPGGTANAPPLSAEPDVFFRPLNPRFDEFLILGSDGLFDFYTNAAACEAVRGVLLKTGDPPRSVRERAQAACEKLVKAATQNGHCSDNVTAVIAMLCADPALPFGS